MVFRFGCLVGLASVLMGAPVTTLSGQQVAGPGEDALVLPRGVLVLRGMGDWQIANQRYGPGGRIEALGRDWNLDSVGVGQIPLLRPLQNGLRELSGLAGLNVSIGQMMTNVSHRTTRIPLGISAGVTQRITLGVTVPLVQTMSDVFLSVSPGSNKGNVALNPALNNAADLNADTAFINQMRRAATAVVAYCAGAGSGEPQCTTGGATATAALAFAEGLDRVYPGALFVPLSGSDVQTAIDARATSYRMVLNAFAGLPGSGVTAIAGTGVTGATLPVSTTEVRALVMDPRFGIQSDSIASMTRWSLGDIEVDAKVLLFDSFRPDSGSRVISRAVMPPSGVSARMSVGGMLRIPTGQSASADDLFDFAASQDAWAVGARGYLDLLVGSKFWTSFVARYDVNFAAQQERRVSDDPSQILLPVFRRMTVERKLGNLLNLEMTPRWVINEFMSVSMQYAMRRKSEDQYKGASVTVGPDSLTGEETIVITPATLGVETGFTEHRVGGGFSFSNLRAYQQGRARIPFEVMYMHSQTVKGSGGYLPKTFTDRVELRVYWRLWGK